MRWLIALVPIVAIAACARPGGPYPSLQPRAAEAIDPRLPVPDPPVSSTPTAGLVNQLDALVAQAVNGDSAFRPLAERAQQLASAAGAKESESWVVAQQALSAAVAARAPVTRAVGDIDALGAQRVQTLGGIGAADLKAIKAAAARVAEIDGREAAVIDQIQRQLSR
jgi:hypothetical protein